METDVDVSIGHAAYTGPAEIQVRGHERREACCLGWQYLQCGTGSVSTTRPWPQATMLLAGLRCRRTQARLMIKK